VRVPLPWGEGHIDATVLAARLAPQCWSARIAAGRDAGKAAAALRFDTHGLSGGGTDAEHLRREGRALLDNVMTGLPVR